SRPVRGSKPTRSSKGTSLNSARGSTVSCTPWRAISTTRGTGTGKPDARFPAETPSQTRSSPRGRRLEAAQRYSLRGHRMSTGGRRRLAWAAPHPVREELTTVGGSLHGGTLMAFADTVGAAATMLNLPPGASTTTVESKTNFFAAGRSGIVRAEATPLHRGRRTMVWQTRVTDPAGRLLSLTL